MINSLQLEFSFNRKSQFCSWTKAFDSGHLHPLSNFKQQLLGIRSLNPLLIPSTDIHRPLPEVCCQGQLMFISRSLISLSNISLGCLCIFRREHSCQVALREPMPWELCEYCGTPPAILLLRSGKSRWNMDLRRFLDLHVFVCEC